MKRPGPRALTFLKRFPTQADQLKAASASARKLVDEITDGEGLDIHPILARPKGAISALEKVIRKDYGLPSVRMTDIVGVRVICYYAEDVDKVVALLRASLEVNDKKSIDKRTSLGLRQFGYRSVHLVVRAGGSTAMRFPDLGNRWFEIQGPVS